ncbi:hypothetical protein GCM10022223_31000 [Kineosporia mesophila]|uniref:Uncharacterized protein n=1 Tax=Kineosporia mesophila TaxID=566012 RepID=A0ABP6ZMM4_9ACTN
MSHSTAAGRPAARRAAVVGLVGDALISVTVVGFSPLTPDADWGTARDLVDARSGPERSLTVVIGGNPE